MKFIFPNDKKFAVDLILQRTGFLVDSGYGDLLKEWTLSGTTTGIKQLASNKEWMKEFLNYCVKTANLDAEQIMNAILPIKSLSTVCSIGPGNCLVELILALKIKASEEKEYQFLIIYRKNM